LESARRLSVSQRVANYFFWKTSFSNSFATAFGMSADLGSHLMGPEEMVDPFALIAEGAVAARLDQRLGGIEDLFGGF
jgi:hypothetical protein